MKTIDKLQLKVKEQSYEITFPNNSQYLRIQNLKSVISPSYEVLSQQGEEGNWALLITDMQAHFMVLCPELVKSLAKPIEQLTMLEGRELVELYTKQFQPWYNECMNVVFSTNKEETENITSETA